MVFQIPWEQDHLAVMQDMQKVLCKLPVTGIINLRLAPSNPATSNFDDVAICKRIASALNILSETPDLRLQLDTFADIDRGYSPRHGLVDRLYNLREAGWLLMTS